LVVVIVALFAKLRQPLAGVRTRSAYRKTRTASLPRTVAASRPSRPVALSVIVMTRATECAAWKAKGVRDCAELFGVWFVRPSQCAVTVSTPSGALGLLA
jgi:hypothetical protein